MAKILWKGHTHGFINFTDVDLAHRHLVMTTSGRPILWCHGNHVHRIRTLTFFVHKHAHGVCKLTGPAISTGNGHHIHWLNAVTTTNHAHHHEVVAPTLAAPNIPRRVILVAIA